MTSSAEPSPPCEGLRIAFVGMGKHVRSVLLPVVMQLQCSKVAYVADRKRPQSQGENCILRQYETFEELCEEVGPSHVLIATSPQVNGMYLERALQRGVRNVFVEKPPAESTAALEKLCSEVQRRGASRVSVGLNFRYARVLCDALALASGHGNVVDVDVDMCCAAEDGADDGERLLDFGIHALDLLVFLTGAPRLAQIGCCRVRGGVQLCVVAEGGEASGVARVGTFSTHFFSRVRVLYESGLLLYIENFDRVAAMTSTVRKVVDIPSSKGAVSYVYPPDGLHWRRMAMWVL